MSIVVEVDESVEDETITEYPWIGEFNGLIVLFTEPHTGVVLSDSIWSSGDWCDSWAEDTFDTFKGAVTLSN